MEYKSIEQIEVGADDQTEVIQSLIRTCYELVEDKKTLEQRIERLEGKADDHDDQLDDHEARLTALGKGVSNINDEQADHEDRAHMRGMREAVFRSMSHSPDTTTWS